MHQGQLVFAQLMRHLPHSTFRRCVARYAGEHQVKSFSCLDQFLCMAFAQLTYRESLRDIEACLRAQASKLYHFGIRGSVARNTLANANATRDWRIYASFAQRLIRLARALYAEEAFGVDLAETVYAFDATTIDRKRHMGGRSQRGWRDHRHPAPADPLRHPGHAGRRATRCASTSRGDALNSSQCDGAIHEGKS